jgi:hypothetical protein
MLGSTEEWNKIYIYDGYTKGVPYITIIFLELVRISLHFMESEKFSQQPQHLSPPWAILIQSMPSHRTYLRFILILSSHLHPGLSSGVSFTCSPKPVYIVYSPIHVTCHVHLLFLDLMTWTYLMRSTHHANPHYNIFRSPIWLASVVGLE